MPDQTQILLQTKLHRPRLPKDLVQRLRLIELLNQDIDRPLFLVCAPAGFGKTTLVSAWLERMGAVPVDKASPLPAAWLTLDENDSDLNIFLHYFIAALRTIFDRACEQTLALIKAQQLLPQEVLSATLSNELEKLPEDCILVLDDYHTIQDEEVHKHLGELLRHWPRLLHLVLISRYSPPIPLSILRARGMLSEIHTRDLRFTPAETAAYLGKSQSKMVSQDALHLLEERFEGWPAGLHLAALSLRSIDSQESVLSALYSENVNITRYLVEEVLTRQFPAIHSFLLKTSILDRYCASLCEAVIGEVDPAWNVRACLDWIEYSELFIIPLDMRGEWYRYHHFFQEMLQQRLSAQMKPDQVKGLHLRASAWFEEHGLLDEALHHSLAAGDLDLVVRQMSAGLHIVLDREDRPTLERWLHLLPEDIIQRQPWLLMIRVWSLQFLWSRDLQDQAIRQVETLLASGAGAALPANELQILRGQLLGFQAQEAYFRNQLGQAIDLSRQALELLPPTWKWLRGGMMYYQGISMQADGQELAAERLLFDEYEACRDKTDAYALFILQALCFNYRATGQLEKIKEIAQMLLQGATHRGLAIRKSWGEYFLGLVHHQCNELEDAARHFSNLVKDRYTAQTAVYRDAVACLALIYQIKGESAEAWQMVESISQFDLEQRGGEDERTRSLRARLMLLRGDLEGAGRWADAFTDLPPDQPLMWLEEPQVTRVRVLLVRGADTDLHLALQILDTLGEIAERTHNTRYKIAILALRALVLDGQGKTIQADTTLEQAVALSRPGGFIRDFVDLGKPMQQMLRKLEKQGHSMEAIRRILAAFPEADRVPISSESPTQLERYPALDTLTLTDRLTPREFEVLTLLREPMSIKEIALDLNISYATARRHTINLYSKLGVNQRWDAVARAEELNILP